MAVPIPRLLVLDSRRRGSLGRIGQDAHRIYMCETHPDGTIVMTPVTERAYEADDEAQTS